LGSAAETLRDPDLVTIINQYKVIEAEVTSDRDGCGGSRTGQSDSPVSLSWD
jgi:hypothetical protein